jgi:hypothetical protein
MPLAVAELVILSRLARGAAWVLKSVPPVHARDSAGHPYPPSESTTAERVPTRSPARAGERLPTRCSETQHAIGFGAGSGRDRLVVPPANTSHNERQFLAGILTRSLGRSLPGSAQAAVRMQRDRVRFQDGKARVGAALGRKSFCGFIRGAVNGDVRRDWI